MAIYVTTLCWSKTIPPPPVNSQPPRIDFMLVAMGWKWKWIWWGRGGNVTNMTALIFSQNFQNWKGHQFQNCKQPREITIAIKLNVWSWNSQGKELNNCIIQDFTARVLTPTDTRYLELRPLTTAQSVCRGTGRTRTFCSYVRCDTKRADDRTSSPHLATSHLSPE